MSYNCRILKAVKTLTEYFVMRGKYRRIEFVGFEATLTNGELKLLTIDTEIIFIKRLGIKNSKCLSFSEQNGVVVYDVRTLTDLSIIDKNIEIFSLDELQYNIFNNFMIPEIYFLTSEQETELKQYYGSKFPILLKTDKICRVLGAQKGELVCFSRNGSLYVRIID
jgi:RNA polymerase Rpb5, C-terminal domain.